jgi:hypothetical protein
MGFDGLLPLAKTMAIAPPESAKSVKVWQKLAPPDPLRPLKGQDLVDQAGTICDLNAYLVMMIAAGVKRVEDMKAAVSGGQVYEHDIATTGKDRAWSFKKNAADQFEQAMIAWSKLPGNGAVQFKFRPEKGVHTFAVERVMFTDLYEKDATKKNIARFRVYQAYEGIYRLSDFLRIAGDENKFLKARLDMYFEGIKPIRFLKYKERLKLAEDNRLLEITAGVTSFDRVTRDFGGGRALSFGDLHTHVIAPLKGMLGGAIDSATYTKLTGVPAHPKYRSLSTDKLLVLMCDSISPGDFEKNYTALPAQDMTMFVDFPQG